MRYFYFISWFTQLTLAIGLLSVSFFIHYAVLLELLNASLFAFALAVIMAMAKVTAIIWHRYFISQHNSVYPDSIRWICLVFKSALFTLSLFLSIVYLSGNLKDLNNEMLINLVHTSQSLFNRHLKLFQVVFVFSIIISLLIELGMILSFETLTVSMQSLMHKQLAFELDKQVLKEKVRNQQQVETIKHDADIDLIKAGAERAMHKGKLKMTECNPDKTAVSTIHPA